jgi:hypothetical protein
MGSVFVHPWLPFFLGYGPLRLPSPAMGRLPKKEAPEKTEKAKAKEPVVHVRIVVPVCCGFVVAAFQAD